MSGKILIVDDVATNRIVLKVKLSAAFYDTLQASLGAEALRLAAEARPDLILLDNDLPDMCGFAVCERLKANPATRDIPVLMIAAHAGADERLKALHAGAEDIYAKPLDELLLLARLRNLLRGREMQEQLGLRDDAGQELGLAEAAPAYAPPGLVGLIAARPGRAHSWRRALEPHMRDRIVVLDRDTALSDHPGQAVPDVFLIETDAARPAEALRFLSELRSRAETRHAGLCLSLPAGAPRDTAATALDLGASDLIGAEADGAELALRLQAQMRRKHQADALRQSVTNGLRLAMIDPLTGLHNRRYGLRQLALIDAQAAQSGREFALLVIDIDRFKQVNDRWGHAAGDAVLTEVAERLKGNLRAGDLIARIGGEEFLAVLPEISLNAAHARAERLRRALSDAPVRLPGGGFVAVTLSIGLAMGGGRRQPSDPSDQLFARADRALLAAKAEGRNQVTIHRSAA